MGESWEDVNWDGVEHRTCINQELGMFCHILYQGMVTAGGWWVAARSWTHWPLKLYADQGTFQEAVAKIFWVSLLAIFSNFTCFLFCCRILIISYTQEHFRLAEGISIEMANIVFDKRTWKVIKDAVKHARLLSTPYTTRRSWSICCNVYCM
jgi:hypothetical protein